MELQFAMYYKLSVRDVVVRLSGDEPISEETGGSTSKKTSSIVIKEASVLTFTASGVYLVLCSCKDVPDEYQLIGCSLRRSETI